jgi:predicted tellurium resistance membrane protein TerC
MGMKDPMFHWGTAPSQSIVNGKLVEQSDFYFAPTGQAIILVLGGLFLLYKSIMEIHHKLQGDQLEEMEQSLSENRNTFGKVILQIILMDLVFSFDSILTAVGLTSELQAEGLEPLPIMIGGMVLSMAVMMFFAGPVGRFVNKYPSIQMLGLSFLILIGFLLVAEAAHASHLVVTNTHVEPLPKAYLYFAIAFSFTVELLNIRASKKTAKVKFNDAVSKVDELNVG